MPMLRAVLRASQDVLVIVLVAVALGELSLRLYNYVDPLPIFYSDSYNRFRGKPFAPDWSFHLNSRGFKDVEFSTNKAAGTSRILGIGDSFAFGVVPYEYNYLTLVEQDLNQSGHHVELINMGIPGIGPREYLSLLAREGLALEPDRILLSFFVGNDFDGPRRSLVSYSYVASLISYVLASWRKFEGQIFHGDATYEDDEPKFTNEAYLEIELKRSAIFLRDNRAFEDQFALALSYLLEMKRLCDGRNIGLTVVLIPDEVQVSNSLQARVVEQSGRGSASFDFALPNRLLRATFEELKIDYLDLTAEFSAGSRNKRLYRPNDSHWNIAGKALAARLISKHVAAQLGPTQ